MRAFVTGSTGLLGSNLVRELVAQGHEVRALVRSREKAKDQFADLKVETVLGDMTDVGSFADALAGCDVLFHTAAFFREYYAPGNHWNSLLAINVDGTRSLMAEAQRRGVKLALDTCSSGIIGLKSDGGPGDESTPPHPIAQKNLYFKSKLLSEENLRRFSAASGFPIIFILPGWMFGPGDVAPTASGQLVLDFLNGKIPGVLNGGSSTVDARDVARGMIAASDRGKPGDRYILGGEYQSLGDILRTLEKVSGKKAPRMRIPYGLGLLAAQASQAYARLSGGTSVLSVEGIRTMHAGLRVSSDKAKRELGITFRPFEETIRDELDWLEQRRRRSSD